MRILLPLEQVKLQLIEKKIENLTLSKKVAKSNCENELCKEIHQYLANPNSLEKLNTICKDLKVDNRLFLKENKL